MTTTTGNVDAGRIDLLRLHVAPERRTVFANPDSHFIFDDRLKLWATLTAEATQAVLKSKDWIVPDYANLYVSLTERTGHDFSMVVASLNATPLANNGETHKKLRRHMATHINTLLPELEKAFPAMIAAAFEPLRSKTRVDIMDECIVPLIWAIIERLSGIEACKSDVTPSRALDALLGMGKRLLIEESFCGFRNVALEAHCDDCPRDIDALGLILSLNILTRDTLGGTIGESLHAVLAANAGETLSAIDWPDDYVETSVSYVERSAARDTETLGISFPKDTRMRTYFLPYTYGETADDSDGIFGTGIHVCLGKRLARMVWTDLVKFLATVDRHARVDGYSMRQGDFVFAHPDRFTVELS